MINIKRFDTNLLSIDKISFKSIDVAIYNIKCITIKSLDHLIFNNINGHIEESNENKYLNFASTNKNKKVLEKYRKL